MIIAIKSIRTGMFQDGYQSHRSGGEREAMTIICQMIAPSAGFLLGYLTWLRREDKEEPCAMQPPLSAIPLNDEPIHEPIGPGRGPETWEWKVVSMLLAGPAPREAATATSYKLGGSPCFIDPRGHDQVLSRGEHGKGKGLNLLPSATARSP